MSWSLQLRNGDITLGQASYGIVTGEDKLVQDLRCYILEKMGTDDAHPLYGSLLDGGRLEDGTDVAGQIGSPNTALTALTVQTEIQRIVENYQGAQLQRARDDRMTYGKTALVRSEILLSLENVNVQQIMDSMNVTLLIQTAAGTTIEFGLEV